MTVAERTQQGRTGSTLIRDDIDGLRAISILAVVAYHAGLPILGGGFVGVDVFFVISGYLITAHLVKEWRSAGRIDLTAFWARRVRRLLPALFVVLLTVLALAPFVLARASGEVGALSRAALSAVALNANHFFLVQAGDYFGPVAETNPLLHLWSLSVEEQFYLVWPLALVLLLPRVRSIAGPIAMLALLSLCFALVITPRMPAAAFFTMPPRAWELLAGALLAVIPLSWPGFKRFRPAMLVSSGFFLVVLAAVFINAGAWFPAPAGVLPVAGAVLILLGGSLDASNRASRLLGSGWMSYLGRVSYPWYLWHWPLLVFSRSRRLYESDPLMDVLMVVLSLVLAVATYEWLEKPMQRRLGISRRLLVKAAAASLGLAVIALALGMWVRYGWNYSPKERQLVQVRGDMPTTGCRPWSGRLRRKAARLVNWRCGAVRRWPRISPSDIASSSTGTSASILADSMHVECWQASWCPRVGPRLPVQSCRRSPKGRRIRGIGIPNRAPFPTTRSVNVSPGPSRTCWTGRRASRSPWSWSCLRRRSGSLRLIAWHCARPAAVVSRVQQRMPTCMLPRA